MAAGDNGRIEAEIVVPTGDWTLTLNEVDGGGDTTATISAGTYTWATYIVEVKSALETASSNTHTYTVSVADGESATGKCTISSSDASGFTLEAGTDAALELMGFSSSGAASDLTPAAQSFTGSGHVQGMWLPDGPPISLTGLGDDLDESDETVAESPDGTVWRLVYQRKSVQRELRYQGISRAKTRIAGESTFGSSFQKFWRDVIQGDKSHFTIGKVRIFPDADTDGTSTQYYVGAGMKNLTPAAMREGWLGLWTITIPRLVKV